VKNPCRGCGGSGVVHREKTLAVTIPQGVEDGTRIRLSGEGEAGIRGGQSGDLYIFVSVAPHRIFRREGPNIHCRVPIPMTTAASAAKSRCRRSRASASASRCRRHPDRQGDPDEGQGHDRAARPRPRRHDGRDRGRDPGQPEQAPAGALREFDKAADGAEANGSGQHPESEGFFAKVRELWDELRD
jgi:molecular chaperone DnaJ